MFQDADEKFNSGLFDLEKDKISRNIKVDNKIIKNIINDLYPPISPYEFSIISVEILGSAYEQFLGKTITIDKAHRAKIEEKPEVRKAGGVYYTPQYIVDYIVKNTVGKLIENSPSPSGRAGVGLTPKEVSKIKIVDPACGSGSFLIGAYQYLLNWHTNYYSKNNKPSKGTKTDLLTPSGRLCTSEKKRILLNNIYGVDIDVNAVEVTKLSLLLKCLEGETTFSIENQLRLFKERVLPTLENNIKSGNSLIDTDIYDSQLDFGEEKKIKPFNWQKAFPEVFNRLIENNETDDLKALAKKAKEHAKKAMEYATELEEIINIVSEPITYYGKLGGFDVVIGNPPYGANFNEDEKKYILSKYHFQNYQLDSYLIFLEKSIKGLLKTGSKLGMIIPNPWLTNLLQKNIRKFVFENTIVDEIVHFKKPVFEQATVDTEIVLLTKNQNKNNQINIVVVEKDKSLLLDNHINIKHKQKEWITENGNAINIFLSETDKILFNKILKNTKPLEEYFSINVGIKPYQVGKGKPKQTRADVDNRVFDSDKPENDLYRKYLRGSDIHQYSTIPLKERYLKFGEWLAEPRLSANFDAEIKIFMRQTGDSLIGTLDTKQFLCLNNMHVLVPKDEFSRQCKYFLGIINSKLMNWYYQTINPEKGEALAEVKKSNVAKLPMLYSSEQKQLEIIKFVDKLLQLNEEIQTIKLQSKIEQFKQHIEHCEDSINKKVYEIYELTKEEIEIVEGK
ncbi:MAG: hypothetical protein A2046_11140 [Bacteroidetes bacterium GWA2_30_7]|nr:MAG: hypothetical protein A2046_11140 [Bacteroidetes bacterium GWA2_30_7]